MTRPLSEQVIEKLKHAENLYHRLILVVGPEGKGKTSALQEVAGRVNAALVNINLARISQTHRGDLSSGADKRGPWRRLGGVGTV